MNNNNNEEEEIEDNVNQNNEIEIEKKEIFKGIILIKEYQTISDKINFPEIEGSYIFKVQLNIMSILHFDLYLENSRNIILENNDINEPNKNILHTKNIINPYETKIVAKIFLKNNWKLKTKYKISLEIPSKGIQYQYIEKDEKKIHQNLENFMLFSRQNFPFEFLSQNEINKKLKELNTKFIDIEFPPLDESIINNEYNLNLDYIIHWRRPEEFINNEIIESLTENNSILRVFKRDKEPEPNDIRQEILSFSFLDSCISALTEKYNLIKRLFITNIYNENGLYKIKLCHNGQWKNIIIDDYFPCIPCSMPIVSNCQSNELWILILQKALAKLFGNYYNLSFINISDFFLTLTGCPSILINLKDNFEINEKNEIFERIKNYITVKKYIALAISKLDEEKINNDNEFIGQNKNNNNKLYDSKLTIQNYGYSIIDIKDKYKPGIIILRKIWYDEKKEKIIDNYTNQIISHFPTLINDLNDNIIILTYDKFLSEFSSLAVCFINNWNEIRLRGKFINIQNENNNIAISKYYYSINLEKPTNLIISLFQENNNINNKNNLFDISLSIFKYDLKNNIINLIKSYDFILSSNIQIELNLPSGNYIIYPRTSGCFFNSYINHIFNINNSEIDEKNYIYNLETKKFSKIFINTIKDIFKKYDIYLNNCLNYEEFNNFYKCINNESLSQKEYNIKISSNYQSYNKSITEKGFIDYFKNKYFEKNGEKEIKKMLYNLGYTDKLFSFKEKSFIITFHSDSEIKIKVNDTLSNNLHNKIEKIILKSNGEIIKKKNNVIVLRYQSKDSNIFSYGILNNDIIPLRIILSFKEYDNIIFNGNNSCVEKIVQPGKYEFYLHLFYFNENDNINDLKFEIEYYLIQ